MDFTWKKNLFRNILAEKSRYKINKKLPSQINNSVVDVETTVTKEPELPVSNITKADSNNINKSSILVAEAETGIGKSFSYLISAIIGNK
mgnify:CR=1 FL=1